MNAAEKITLIDAFEQAAFVFDDLRGLSPEVLVFRPFPEAWTIHEQVVHVLESDIAGWHRYRRAIAQPDTPVLGYDEEVWTPALKYHQQDLGLSLDLLKAGRRFAAAHLRGLAGEDWSGWAYKHSAFGRVSLEKWVGDYVEHVRFHRELVDRNIKAWKTR